MALTDIFRWSVFFHAFPRLYLDTESDWSEFDIASFNERYEWDQDEWGGLRDTIQAPNTTRSVRHGDCEDYSALIASYLLSETDEPVSLGFVMDGRLAHSVCFTDDTVYSSGRVHDKTFEEYVADSRWGRVFVRELRG